mgnify:CR=1 FL=1
MGTCTSIPEHETPRSLIAGTILIVETRGREGQCRRGRGESVNAPEHETVNNKILEESRHEANSARPFTAPTKELPDFSWHT